jgi:hypothetical protein
MSVLTKGIWTWLLLLLVVMMGNGVLRVLVLQPRLGEALARQWACLSGILVIFVMTGLFVQRLGPFSRRELLQIGALWVVLTVAFEFLFGRFVSGASWEALLAEYDLTRGRLWPLVLFTTLIAPLLWGVVRDDEGNS